MNAVNIMSILIHSHSKELLKYPSPNMWSVQVKSKPVKMKVRQENPPTYIPHCIVSLVK